MPTKAKKPTSGVKLHSEGNTVRLTLYRRYGTSYEIRFYINRKPKTIGFNHNELEARRILKALAYDLDAGKLTLDDLVTLTGKEIIRLYQQPDRHKLTLIESIKCDRIDERNLKDIWEQYKLIAVNHIAKTTQKKQWRQVDNFLSKLTDHELSLSNLNHLVSYALKHYSETTIRRYIADLQIALNVVINGKKLGDKRSLSNDFNLSQQLSKQVKKKPRFFTIKEIQILLESIKNAPINPYASNNIGLRYYYPLINFLANTGCRPSEAIALTWADIKISDNRVQILINKVYTQGILKHETKNKLIRLIPLNPTLAKFMINYRQESSNTKDSDLVFPSVNNGYINFSNFQKTLWIKHVKELAKQGLIREYLTPYCLRHSFVTNMIQKGVDIATIAGLIGDCVGTVINFYLGNTHENASLPDIY